MTTTFAPPAGHTTGSDPTDVLGRRFAAWFVDVLLSIIIVGGAMAMVGEYKNVPDSYDDKTEFCEDLLDANRDFEGNCIAPPVGDRVFLIEYSDSLIYSGVGLVWFLLNLVVLQGATGGSVGKLLAGVRVVDAQGTNAGMGRCLGRSLMWIVDALPIIPLVGGITALTTNGHRRVGDMVAGTFVVGGGSVGRPVNTPAVSTPSGAQAWGAAPVAQQQQAWPQPAQPSWETPAPAHPEPAHPESAQPASWAAPSTHDQPTEAQPVVPAQPGPAYPVEPVVAPAPEEPLGIGSEPEPETAADPDVSPGSSDEPTAAVDAVAPSEDEPPSFDPSATVAGAHAPWSSTAASPTEPSADAAPSSPEPQWDAARGTYIQWDDAAGAWVQWDAASNSWIPIS